MNWIIYLKDNKQIWCSHYQFSLIKHGLIKRKLVDNESFLSPLFVRIQFESCHSFIFYQLPKTQNIAKLAHKFQFIFLSHNVTLPYYSVYVTLSFEMPDNVLFKLSPKRTCEMKHFLDLVQVLATVTPVTLSWNTFLLKFQFTLLLSFQSNWTF